jgi:putative tryptophan/tyrosine transport system substrate-binding protein
VARDAPRLVARVLNGREAGELPIEQPTRFELVVNLQATKALGIVIPSSVLLRAERVIE